LSQRAGPDRPNAALRRFPRTHAPPGRAARSVTVGLESMCVGAGREMAMVVVGLS